jgi:glutamate-1-semialdehyde 2,1-aminomutase
MEVMQKSAAPVQTQLAALEEAFIDGNSKSRTLFEKAARVMPGGNTRSNLYYEPFPLYFVSGEGATLTDADGHRYVDFLCEYTVGVFGHSHPDILQAIAEISAKGLNLGGQNVWEVSFAAAIADRFPAMDKVRFVNSGTEANLMAIGAARIHTGREKILIFDGGYHGSVFTFVSPGHPLTAPFPFLSARYNDIESVQQLIAANAGQIAAVLVEPMLSSGGCIPARDDFLHELRRLTTAARIVLILDEVVTSRLEPHGIHGAIGLTPDLVTLGKYIGGGLGCGAFGGRQEIMDNFNPTRRNTVTHAGTFNNNTLTMGVGTVAICEIFTPAVAEGLRSRGDALRRRLNTLTADQRVRMQFTGRGSSMNLHFAEGVVERPNSETRGHAMEKSLFFFHFLSQGLYLAPRGMLNLSMMHSDHDIDRVVEATDSFIARYRDVLPMLSAGSAA